MKWFLGALAALLLPGCALAQSGTAAIVEPSITAANCGSWSDSVNLIGDSGVGCANHQVTIDDGTHGSMVLAPTIFGAANSAAILNTKPGQPLYFAHTATSGADVADFLFSRVANYAGGTSGFVNSTTRFRDTVSAGATSYEWTLTSIMDNSSTLADAAQNVAIYGQAHKRSTGATWAATFELQDHVASPSTSSVTVELDHQAKGTDPLGGRVILDGWAKSDDGAAAVVGYGMRLNTDANTTLTNGFSTSGATISNAAYAMGATQKLCGDGFNCTDYLTQNAHQWHVFVNSTDALQVTALGTNALALQSTVGNIGLPAGASLCLDGNGTCNNKITDTSGALHLYASGSDIAQVTSLGLNAVALQSTSSNIGLPAGQKLCLDGNGTCLNYLTDTSNVVHTWANGTDIQQVSALGTSSVALNATVSGIGLPAGQKLCLDTQAVCSTYLNYSGSTLNGFVGSNQVIQVGSAGRFTSPSLWAQTGDVMTGGKLCVDGTTCSNYLAQTAANQIHLWANGTDIAQATALGFNAVALGTTVSGVSIPSGQKYCLDGGTCSIYITYNSGAGVMSFFMGGTQVFNISSGGILNVLTGFRTGIAPTGITATKTAGSCTFNINGGIITGVSGC